jgi:type III secretion protein V
VDASTPEGETFRSRVNEVRALLFEAYGVIVPELVLRPRPDLPDRTLVVALNDVPVRRISIPEGRVMVPQPPDQLAIFGLEAEPFVHPVSGRPASLVPAEQRTLAERAQFDVFDVVDLIRLHVHGYAAQNLQEFIDLQTTQALVNALSESHGDLVAAVTPKPVRLSEVAELLKRLLREQVSVRDLARILESAGKWRIAQPQAAGLDLAELVRSDLGRRICQRALGPGGRLPICLVDAEIEETIAASILHTETGPELGISNEDLDAVMEAIRQALGRVPSSSNLPAVLCTNPRSRPFLRILIAQEFPDALVLSARELSGAPEIRPEPAGAIRMAPAMSVTA